MKPLDLAWLVAGTVLPGVCIAWAAGHFVRRRAAGWGLIDQPGQRKVHETPTPLGGGLAIWLGVVVPLALGQGVLYYWKQSGANLPFPGIAAEHLNGLWEKSADLWLLVGLATALLLLGLCDDRWGLDWRLRLAVETLVASAVVLRGWQFSLFLDLPWLTATVTVLWIVGLINAFNMLDNMDGLSGGVAAISAGMFALVMLTAPEVAAGTPQLFVAGFLLVMVGAVLGFLFHNLPPARLFMGDAGSYFIGFWLAVGTVLATFAGEDHPRHLILAPLCVLAVPLYDITTVIAIRLRQGRSPFEADKNHFSHRLVALGMSKTQAVLTIYLVTAATGLGALLLYQVRTTFGAFVILLLVLCMLSLIRILERTGRR